MVGMSKGVPNSKAELAAILERVGLKKFINIRVG
jgi:hypothetical protein